MNSNGGTYWNNFSYVVCSTHNQNAATAHKTASTPPGELIRISDMILWPAEKERPIIAELIVLSVFHGAQRRSHKKYSG